VHTVIETVTGEQEFDRTAHSAPGSELERVEQPDIDARVLRQCCQRQFTFANVKVVEQQAHPHTPVSRAQYLVRQEPTGYVLRPSVILEIKRPGRCASAEDTPGEELRPDSFDNL
jgi:hypothetical protein